MERIAETELLQVVSGIIRDARIAEREAIATRLFKAIYEIVPDINAKQVSAILRCVEEGV